MSEFVQHQHHQLGWAATALAIARGRLGWSRLLADDNADDEEQDVDQQQQTSGCHSVNMGIGGSQDEQQQQQEQEEEAPLDESQHHSGIDADGAEPEPAVEVSRWVTSSQA